MLLSFIYFAVFCCGIILLLRLYCRLTVGRYKKKQCMSGKTVLITGASGGIGKATALDLARRNARVLLGCRNLEKAEKVKSEIVRRTGNENIVVKLLDLESFDSVRRCAKDVLETEQRLDVLINNAGILHCEMKLTEDGCERIMQTNHLGHFLLTLLLLDLLRKSQPSRIINVASIMYLAGVLNLDDMKGTNHNLFLRHLGNYYNRSKLANIWFTTELSRRLAGTGVTVNCLHPGLIHTDIFYKETNPIMLMYKFLLFFFGKNVEEGAQTSIYLAVDPDVEKLSGKFFYDCREGRLYLKALNKAEAGKFFELSEEIVGIKFENLMNGATNA